MDKSYLMQVAQTAMEQILCEVGSNVVASWGVHGWGCGTIKNINGVICPCLILKVSGLIHTGLVVVALNEASDVYEVRLMTQTGEPVGEWQLDVYCDMLGSLIDSLVERPVGMTDKDYRELSELDSFVKCLSDMI